MSGHAKPSLNLWQIWNMSFGFFGIQIAFGLQNGNASRIFESLGADIANLALFWLAGPITGLVVQPIVGHFSDKTWTWLGRRRPYFLIGAIIGSVTLIFMPHSPALWIAVASLWILDSAINITMEPFRAFVGDMLPSKQRATGYAMQGIVIGIGAFLASNLPLLLTGLGIANTAENGGVPDNVKIAFAIGGALFFSAVLWTVVKTKEYSPEDMRRFEQNADMPMAEEEAAALPAGFFLRFGGGFLIAGLALTLALYNAQVPGELFIFTVGLAVFGLLNWFVAFLKMRHVADMALSHIMTDLVRMPPVMRRLAVVQFFSWFALFIMWIYTNSAVTAHHFGTSDTSSLAYNQGADLVGSLFGFYNLAATAYTFAIPRLVALLGAARLHGLSLLAGALGLAAIYFVESPTMLYAAMIGVGMAWASILTLPYVLLSDAVPAAKMGIYMGIFNLFIVIPQVIVASIIGFILEHLFNGLAIYTLLLAALVMAGGGVSAIVLNIERRA